MADNRTKEQRSYNMSRIRSKDTKPEIAVRKFLHSKGFRYRLHSKLLPGKPDIVITRLKIVIFVHGCFWHGHERCKNAKTPVNNRIFWQDKIKINAMRDNKNVVQLQDLGWKICTIWECELSKENLNATFDKLLLFF